MFWHSGLHHSHHWFNLRSGGKHTVFPSVKVIFDCFSPPCLRARLSLHVMSIICHKDLCSKNVQNHSPHIQFVVSSLAKLLLL